MPTENKFITLLNGIKIWPLRYSNKRRCAEGRLELTMGDKHPCGVTTAVPRGLGPEGDSQLFQACSAAYWP